MSEPTCCCETINGTPNANSVQSTEVFLSSWSTNNKWNAERQFSSVQSTEVFLNSWSTNPFSFVA